MPIKLDLDRLHAKRHDDDDYVDEIRIRTVERYKTSGLSGDEWRFSAVIQFFRKGQLLHERGLSDIETALQYAPWALATAYEGDNWEYAKDDDLCFQPGCTNKWVSEFQLSETFSSRGERLDPSDSHSKYVRRFCQKHLRRGDCGREDSDANYILISGPGPDDTDWTDANITESARVEVNVDSMDEVPDAIREAAKQFRN
jgi:hypothetical protein